jgi:hypothetical protein
VPENISSSPEDLAASFPDLYFDLQCAQLQAELLEEHHFQASVSQNGTKAEAVIYLNDGFALILTPTIPGFGGYTNWLHFRSFPDPRTKRQIRLSQYRCGVELVQGYGSEEQTSLLTFGIDAGDVAELIDRALNKIKDRCGLRLVALPVVHIEPPSI